MLGLAPKLFAKEISNNLQDLGGALAQTIEQISVSQKERLHRVSTGGRVNPEEWRTARGASKDRRGTAGRYPQGKHGKARPDAADRGREAAKHLGSAA
jgi:hypothetical protein